MFHVSISNGLDRFVTQLHEIPIGWFFDESVMRKTFLALESQNLRCTSPRLSRDSRR